MHVGTELTQMWGHCAFLELLSWVMGPFGLLGAAVEGCRGQGPSVSDTRFAVMTRGGESFDVFCGGESPANHFRS
ncbi:hypothetical protein BG28_10995 [Nesterenkonia sp. AN1]|nr:hypothetical protein BG28_10995 [Nesterenkonia sp. AN1]